MTDNTTLIEELRGEASNAYDHGHTEFGDMLKAASEIIEAADARLATARTLASEVVKPENWLGVDPSWKIHVCTRCGEYQGVAPGGGVVETHKHTCPVALAERWLAEGDE